MGDVLTARLRALDTSQATQTLAQIRRGLEKESLRITPQGYLAQTQHPKALGSALTHPYITTDYSEALLEFITPPTTSLSEPIALLEDLHRYTYQHIDDELLWVNSMPCIMTADDEIPIAQYGSSNSGKMKTVYRVGLGERYGRRMQTIAGIHYNVSFDRDFWLHHQAAEGDTSQLQSFISRRYFDLTRNFQRYSWLINYLFGASPAVCASFLDGRDHELITLTRGTLYQPYATSLRMSDIGYQNNAQSALSISYNNLEEYVRDLTAAINTPEAMYEDIGVKQNGEYRQLNTNILQIENEYYSSVRPKQVALSGERPTQALARRGVEYVEIRTIDLNPFDPVGINEEQMRFLDVFTTFCLMSESPALSRDVLRAAKNNIRQVVYRGRDTSVELCNFGTPTTLKTWANELLDRMVPIAELFDKAHGSNAYSEALAHQRDKVAHPALTASARILATLEDEQQSFFDFAMEQARKHQDYFLNQTPSAKVTAELEALAEQSLAEQAEIEASDTMSFEDFLASYYRDDA